MLTQPKYTALTLTGGGVKGFVYIGVALELEKYGVLKDIEKISGSSAGAISALLMATGATPAQLRDMMFSLNLKKMVYGHDGIVSDIENLIEEEGAHQGKGLMAWFEKMIEQTTGNKACTFKEWHEYKQAHPDKHMRDLIIMAYNGSRRITEEFSYTATPHVAVKDAVRASMAYPGFFTPHKIGECVYSDGGIQANSPIDVFSTHQDPVNAQALGVLLVNQPFLNFLEFGEKPPIQKIDNLVQQAEAVLEGVLNAQVAQLVRNQHLGQYALCDDLGVGSLDFDLDLKMKEALVYSGRIAMIVYFATHHPAYFKDHYSIHDLHTLIKEVNDQKFDPKVLKSLHERLAPIIKHQELNQKLKEMHITPGFDHHKRGQMKGDYTPSQNTPQPLPLNDKPMKVVH